MAGAPESVGDLVDRFPVPRPAADYSLDPYRPDSIRARLGYAILALLMAVIALMAVQMFRGYLETREFVEIVFPAVLASAGTALGFYYSERSDSR